MVPTSPHARPPPARAVQAAAIAQTFQHFDEATTMTPDPTKPDADNRPDVEHLSDALDHINSAVQQDSIAVGAARGLVYSVIETLGTLVGDPDLPEHARSGYEGLLETAREIRARLDSGKH
ncbi:hypothetical protein CURE108131_14740 [Cupriavidus respiraculi]|uniref:Major surface protein 3 n=2 Tax=Cupriavidus respiraculi TaxID=195930 RepID=A0ABM8XNR2_9BURK|nr:hypothetical protein LMG21510_04425 [Cupriavidus respiraculi]